jgi:hypothetical protein
VGDSADERGTRGGAIGGDTRWGAVRSRAVRGGMAGVGRCHIGMGAGT